MSINRDRNLSMKTVSRKMHSLEYKLNNLGLNPNVLTIGVNGTTGKVHNFDARLVTKELAVTNAQNVHSATEVLLAPAMAKLKMYVSHYFTGIINGTKREYFAMSDRTTVGLNLTNDQYMPLETYADILAAGKKIVDNDHLRVDAIAKPMALPSKAEVQVVYDNALLIHNDNANNTQALNTANTELMALLPEGIALCNKSDNEIETYFDNGNKTSMRDNSRLWGIVYFSSTPIAYLDLTALTDPTHVACEHIHYIVEPGEEVGDSDVQGFKRMNIHQFGPIILHYASDLYLPGSLALNIGENETIVQTIFLTLRP